MSDQKLSPSAQRIQDQLGQMGFDYQVIEFQETTRTSADAAARVGCSIGQIVKSLIFKARVSGKPVLVLTSGINRVDLEKLSGFVGEPVIRADPDYVRQVTGFSIGGIPPFGYDSPIETYIDLDLLQYDHIWAAAGTPNAVFKLTPRSLISLSSARKVHIKEEN